MDIEYVYGINSILENVEYRNLLISDINDYFHEFLIGENNHSTIRKNDYCIIRKNDNNGFFSLVDIVNCVDLCITIFYPDDRIFYMNIGTNKNFLIFLRTTVRKIKINNIIENAII